VGKKIHHKCRKAYCDLRSLQKVKDQQNDWFLKVELFKQSLPTDLSQFSFCSTCLFSGCVIDPKNLYRMPFHFMRSGNFDQTLRKACEQRGDKWPLKYFATFRPYVTSLHFMLYTTSKVMYNFVLLIQRASSLKVTIYYILLLILINFQ